LKYYEIVYRAVSVFGLNIMRFTMPLAQKEFFFFFCFQNLTVEIPPFSYPQRKGILYLLTTS